MSYAFHLHAETNPPGAVAPEETGLSPYALRETKYGVVVYARNRAGIPVSSFSENLAPSIVRLLGTNAVVAFGVGSFYAFEAQTGSDWMQFPPLLAFAKNNATANEWESAIEQTLKQRVEAGIMDRYKAWMVGTKSGASSIALFRFLHENQEDRDAGKDAALTDCNAPGGIADLSRCLGMLNLFPELLTDGKILAMCVAESVKWKAIACRVRKLAEWHTAGDTDKLKAWIESDYEEAETTNE